MLNKTAAALFTFILLINPAFSGTWHDVLPDAKEVGKGEFRWLIFDIYSAKLWSQTLPFDADKPFALELTYHRKITSEQFVNSSIDEIHRIHGTKYSTEKLVQWTKALANIFPKVNKGDQLIGVYLPNHGAVFFNKEKRLAEIKDPELATAFFSIWLDERTKDKTLRAALMGTHKGETR